MSVRGYIKPFQGFISWRCHHRSEGRYRLTMRLRPFRARMDSPKGATYAKDGYSPSIRPITPTSPEGAEYANDEYSLSDTNMKAMRLRPFRAKMDSPEGAEYANDRYILSDTNMKAMSIRPFRARMDSPERAIYTKDGSSPSKRRTTPTSPEGARYANDGHSPSEKKTKNKINPEGV